MIFSNPAYDLTKKVKLGLPSEYRKWGTGPSLCWQTVPFSRCSHRKGAVPKSIPTSRRHLQCRGDSRAKTATSDDLWCRPQAVRQPFSQNCLYCWG